MRFEFFPRYCGGVILTGWMTSSKVWLVNSMSRAYMVLYGEDLYEDAYLNVVKEDLQVFFVLNKRQKEKLQGFLDLKQDLGAELLCSRRNPNSDNMCYTYVTSINNLKEFIAKNK